MTSWEPSLIPRKTFQARRVTQTEDAYNLVTEAYEEFTITNAGIQPMSTNERKVLTQGLQDKKAYKLFTTTPIDTTEEGVLQKGDEISIYNSWYEVLQVDNWDYGIQSHYEAIVVESNER